MATTRRQLGRRGHGHSNPPDYLSLEDIHRALPAAVVLDDIFHDAPTGENDTKIKKSTDVSAIRTHKPTKASGATPFHDALNEYIMFARPREESDVRNLASLIVRLVGLSGTSPDQWKVFLLVAFNRRYHARAPAAKSEGEKKDSNIDGDEDESAVVGDGERLIFYVTCLTLVQLTKLIKKSPWLTSADPDPQDTKAPAASSGAVMATCSIAVRKEKYLHLLQAAALSLVNVATEIGGTRDINALIEHLTFQALLDHGCAQLELVDKKNAPKSFEKLLLPALDIMLDTTDQRGKFPSLDLALETAATLLDEDINICARSANEEDEIMSTIHMTLPHCNRGRAQGSSFQRKLANCVAEILIWQRTSVCQNEERFSCALNKFRKRKAAESAMPEASVDVDHKYVLQMQTTARKKRKILNDTARSQGSMLCSLFLEDRALVSFRHIRRGKAGDLAMLKKLASKVRDKRVLKMLAARNIDPSKAPPIESVSTLVSSWRDIRAAPDEDSVEALELELQAQTVRVTIQKLKAKVKGGSTDGMEERRVLVASLGGRKADAACAILVAAALQPHSRLLVCSRDWDVSSNESTMEALNQVIIDGFDASDGKSAQAILGKDLGDFSDAVFLSSSDIEVDEAMLERLQVQDKTVRVHATSSLESVEPITIELDSEISDRLRSGSPISVSVLLDCTGSMGCEIEGCKKGALAAIDAFNDLAPVNAACFLGYWDPVNSRGDPEPRSTGFLDPRLRENVEKIQSFVDTKLPCTGGGDEPEDIPAALEKLLDDMKGAGMSAQDGVHFVFFIADAGYRPNEDERVSLLLRQLGSLGVVMVMCPVRNSGTCTTLVAKNKEVFLPGKYIEVEGVSALEKIACTVTESIRASLFRQGNVASVTASVGETMESLCQLCAFQKDHRAMKRVAELSAMPPETDKSTEDSSMGEVEERSADMEEGTVSDNQEAAEDSATETKTAEPIFVPSGTFSLTNIDRIYIQISSLPDACHRVVENAFGGKTLQELVAGDIASRLMKEGVPVSELRVAGYPSSIVELVREIMGGHGMRRQQQVTKH